MWGDTMPFADETTEVNFKIHCRATDAILLSEAVKMKMDTLSKSDPKFKSLSDFYGLFRKVACLCV